MEIRWNSHSTIPCRTVRTDLAIPGQSIRSKKLFFIRIALTFNFLLHLYTEMLALGVTSPRLNRVKWSTNRVPMSPISRQWQNNRRFTADGKPGERIMPVGYSLPLMVDMHSVTQ